MAPAPELDRTLVVAAGSVGECLALLGAALRSSHDVSAAGSRSRARQLAAARRLRGLRRSADARALRRAAVHAARTCSRATRRASAGTRSASAAALAASPVVWRISVPPADAPRVLERLEPDRYLLDWGGGLIFAAYATVDAPRVRGALTSGHATLLKAPAAARAATAVFQPQPPAVAAVAARAAQRVRSARHPEPRPHGLKDAPCRPVSPPRSSRAPSSRPASRSCASACTAVSAPRRARPTCCSATSSTARAAASI